MPSPPNMEHPNHQLPKVKNSLFAYLQNTPTRGGKCGLTVGLPEFHPKCPLRGTYRIYIIIARSGLPLRYWYIQQKVQNLSHIHTKRTCFPKKKRPRGKARSNVFWKRLRHDSRQRWPPTQRAGPLERECTTGQDGRRPLQQLSPQKETHPD